MPAAARPPIASIGWSRDTSFAAVQLAQVTNIRNSEQA